MTVKKYHATSRPTLVGNSVREMEKPIPSADDIEDAVRTLLAATGDDPLRDGLLDTPARVRRSFQELFEGYHINPLDYLERTFSESNGYSEPVIITGITFQSTCEHHILPFMGSAHVAYLPEKRVVGLSKLCRVVHAFARRLQMQERLTEQIAETIEQGLSTKGVAVLLRAHHTCMCMRGVRSENAATTTTSFRGAFASDPSLKQQFYQALQQTPL